MTSGSAIRRWILSFKFFDFFRDVLRNLIHLKVLLLSAMITVPMFLIILFIWLTFFSIPSPEFDEPGYLAVEYLLSSLYSGTSNCTKIENEIGKTIAPNLIECSGWGYSMKITNVKSGYVIDLERRYAIKKMDSEGKNFQLFVDVENGIEFRTVDGVIRDFSPVISESIRKRENPS
jgi:hypothetical protein